MHADLLEANARLEVLQKRYEQLGRVNDELVRTMAGIGGVTHSQPRWVA